MQKKFRYRIKKATLKRWLLDFAHNIFPLIETGIGKAVLKIPKLDGIALIIEVSIRNPHIYVTVTNRFILAYLSFHEVYSGRNLHLKHQRLWTYCHCTRLTITLCCCLWVLFHYQ